MRITVLAENSVYKANSMNVKSEHDLSLFIEFDKSKILFDTGQSDLFIHTAEKMGIDLSQADYLVISHGHFDYGGGLQHFLKINNKAKIFLHINEVHNFYTKIIGFIPYYVGLDKRIIVQSTRIYFIEEDTQISDKMILLEGFTEIIPQSESNKELFEKTNNRFIVDKFNHEIVMLLIEDEEIVLFSGCSNSGIINIIEEVKLFSKTMKIKATFGGFHIHNHVSNKNESMEYIDNLKEALGETDQVFYTGHCTVENNFRIIKGWMGRKIQTISTGEVIEV